MSLSVSTMSKVVLDLASGVPPGPEYTPEMVAFYEKAKAEIEAYGEIHPGTLVYVPNELPE